MNQSFKQVFVTNSGTLLASGSSILDLSVGQVGVFDGDTYKATTSPTYFNNKKLLLGWGYPDIESPALMSGQFNANEFSPFIDGKKIKKVRVRKASKGRKEIVVAGFTGDVTDTNTLSIRPGEKKYFYLRLTGAPIDRLYSTQGFVRRYVVEGPCLEKCLTDCDTSTPNDNRPIAESLAKQIQNDLKFKGLVKASTIIECTPSLTATTTNCYVFEVSLCDDGSDNSLGFVQSQYPGLSVRRSKRVDSTSTYQITRNVNTLPSPVSNSGLTIIPDCPTCPAGYTLVASGFVYEVKRADAGNAAALTTLNTDYGIIAPETSSRISYNAGVSTYIFVSSTQLTAVGVDNFKFIGQSTNSCVITTPTTTAWLLADTLVKYDKKYRITIADSICGTSRLTDLQAAFPNLVISAVNVAGACVHTFETTVQSQCVKPGCSSDLLEFKKPDSFEGVDWVEVSQTALPAGTVCKSGLKLESAWVDRITNECTYNDWPYEADGVHIEFFEYDGNYNAEPEVCKKDSTVVRTIQTMKYTQGHGAFVRKMEERSKELFLKNRSYQPIVREIEGYQFIADPTKLYDQVTIEFDSKFLVGSFSQQYTNSTHLDIFVLEGKGSQLVNALNTFITSPEIGMDAVAY